MPRLLARKLVCFYCNRRSAQDRSAGIQRWQCEKCDAVNYLDKNGEIMDPPAQATSSSKRYAQPRSRPASPKSGFQRSLFCPRCIQNQHIVNQALAEYLPSQDDPRCMQFERKIPEYRRKMEADFPQVCETCAPAVEDRIRSTGYAAKTDHLRRMMNRTRGAGITFNSWTWKRVGGVLGTIGWTTGFLGQLCWDLFGALPPTHADDGLPSEDEPQSIATCLISGTLNIQSTPSCNELLQPMLVFTFVLSLLFFWWNPRMQYKLRGGYGRIVGYIEYYKLQLIALAIRYAGWKLMAKDSVVHIDPQATRALHAFSLVAGIMLTVLSFYAIRIDQQPLVSFQENYEPLVAPLSEQQTSTTTRQTLRNSSSPWRRRAEPFPIEKLAPRPQQPVYQPPTPPPEEDSEDCMMEWSPQHNFGPVSTYRAPQPKPAYDGPSPFHGVLPPAPISWAQRLRNPPTQPAFQKASETKKGNFFGRKNQSVVSDAASDITSPAHSVTHASMFDMDSPVKFAPPRFFAPADRMETGLESLFSNAFSLGKDQSSTSLRGPPDIEAKVSAPAPKTLPRLIATLLLGASCIAWDYVSIKNLASRDFVQIISIVIAGLNTLYNLSLAIPRTDRNLGYILLQILELLIAAAFARALTTPSNSEKEWQITAFGHWYLMALTIREGWYFVSSLAAPPAGASAEVPKPVPQNDSVPARKVQAPNEASKRLAGKTPNANNPSTLTAKAKANGIELNQWTTRTKTRNDVRRDSLGVDRLGSLSLGSGW
ncbi:MAG: hypothetical protein LQ343_003681 [Gyalolechia ehrenbergii]|nr:MAG: hypothetical protein LQ343_003681 [Gyalolechia ehrenbergii]